jgi:hypothetical protein
VIIQFSISAKQERERKKKRIVAKLTLPYRLFTLK